MLANTTSVRVVTLRWLIGLLAAAMVLTLSACQAQPTGTPTARPGVTPSATAGSDSLITVLATAQQTSGSIRQHNLVLTVRVSVFNYTDQEIVLAGDCHYQPIGIVLSLRGSNEPPTDISSTVLNCSPGVTNYILQPTIAAHSVQTYARVEPIFSYRDDWQAGVYVVLITIPNRLEQPPVASDQTTVVLQ